jgi:hypothetical protein
MSPCFDGGIEQAKAGMVKITGSKIVWEQNQAGLTSGGELSYPQ